MLPVICPAVAWLLALVMPFQALMVIYLDVRGPAHFHVMHESDRHVHPDAHGPGHGQNRTHEYSHVLQATGLEVLDRHEPSHSRGPDGVEHHHHHPDDSSVVTVAAHAVPDFFALKEEATPGWSGAMLVTLPADSPVLRLTVGASVPPPLPESLLQTRFLGRLERPPRFIS